MINEDLTQAARAAGYMARTTEASFRTVVTLVYGLTSGQRLDIVEIGGSERISSIGSAPR